MNYYYKPKPPYKGFSLWVYILVTVFGGLSIGLYLLEVRFIIDFISAIIWACILAIFIPMAVYMVDQGIINYKRNKEE